MESEITATFIIFGGSGDLARRKLYPALFNLFRKGLLREHFAVIGTARRPWSNDYFREIITESVMCTDYDPAQVKDFASHFFYQSHDVTDTKHYIELKKLAAQLDQEFQTGGNRIFYMAMSPKFFGTIATHLHDEDVLGTGFNRLIIEKPFGRDLASAEILNKQINDSFAEEDVYRIDHYLGKEMVQNIMPLRFSNALIANIWNKTTIENIQVTLAEQLGVEERGGYYDTAGALRDMVQNHIFQIIVALAMPQPENLSDSSIHAAKKQLLDSLIMPTKTDLAHDFVRGQYDANGELPAYRQEPQVAPDSNTETYVAGKVKFSDGPLAGVPIYFRTGKRLRMKSSRIDIVLKNKNELYQEAKPDVLTIELDPINELKLRINGKRVTTVGLRQENLIYQYTEADTRLVADAYELLIEDVLKADRSKFTNWHELRASWKFIDQIEDYFQAQNGQDLQDYHPFTMGPKASQNIFENPTDRWILD